MPASAGAIPLWPYPIGENGSGKSTFCQMLCGIYTIGGGTFTLDGKELHIRNQVEANNAGISIIVQEMGTLSGLTVAENIFLGHEEPFTKHGIKNSRAMNREAQRLLDQYGFGRIRASARRGRQFQATNLLNEQYDSYWAVPDGDCTPSFEIRLPESRVFNRVLLQEYIPLGQRVSSFTIEASTDGAPWREIASGTTIGYKRILLTEKTRADAIRVRITGALACPVLNRFGLYLD